MEAQYLSHSYTSPYLAHTSLYLADRTPSGGGRISRVTDFLEVGDTHVVEQFLDVTTDKGLGHGIDGPNDDIIATTDGEDESIAGITGIRGDDDVGGGVIRIRVHGIGARERGRCREPEITRADFGNNAHSALPWKNV